MTFREALRNSALSGSFAVACLVIGAGSIFSGVSLGDFIRMVKEFSLFSMTVLLVGFLSVFGSLLVHNELKRRTLYLSLSKGVSRQQFVLGKHFGLLLASLALWVVSVSITTLYIGLLEQRFDSLYLLACVAILLEVLLLASVVTLLSVIITTPLLVGLVSLALWIVGRSAWYLQELVVELGTIGQQVATAVQTILPRFDLLNFSERLLVGVVPSRSEILLLSIYAVCYSTLLVLVASFIFSKKKNLAVK